MSRPLSLLEQARRAALRGEVDPALAALRALAATGDDGASASLAELLAFRGEWEELIAHAGRLVANPGAVFSGDVFDDMVRLLGRAGHETGEWRRIGEAADAAARQVERTVDRPHLRHRYATILTVLRKYAARRGAPPHELVRVFGPERPPASPELCARQHRAAVDHVLDYRPDLEGDPDALAVHLFALARTFRQGD